jgi:hypothetical protein
MIVKRPVLPFYTGLALRLLQSKASLSAHLAFTPIEETYQSWLVKGRHPLPGALFIFHCDMIYHVETALIDSVPCCRGRKSF